MSTDNIKQLPDQAEPKILRDSLKSASPVLIKIFEVVLSALCLSLIFVPFDNKLQISMHRTAVVGVGLSLPLITNVVLLYGHFRREPSPKSTIYAFSFICGILLIAAGSVLMADWWTFMRSLHFRPPKMFMDLMMSASVFSFILGLLCFLDVYLTYLYY